MLSGPTNPPFLLVPPEAPAAPFATALLAGPDTFAKTILDFGEGISNDTRANLGYALATFTEGLGPYEKWNGFASAVNRIIDPNIDPLQTRVDPDKPVSALPSAVFALGWGALADTVRSRNRVPVIIHGLLSERTPAKPVAVRQFGDTVFRGLPLVLIGTEKDMVGRLYEMLAKMANHLSESSRAYAPDIENTGRSLNFAKSIGNALERSVNEETKQTRLLQIYGAILALHGDRTIIDHGCALLQSAFRLLNFAANPNLTEGNRLLAYVQALWAIEAFAPLGAQIMFDWTRMMEELEPSHIMAAGFAGYYAQPLLPVSDAPDGIIPANAQQQAIIGTILRHRPGMPSELREHLKKVANAHQDATLASEDNLERVLRDQFPEAARTPNPISFLD